MIPAVSRGGRMRGLFRYLVGPGQDGEHHEPHLVAGQSAEPWQGVQLDGWAADRIAEQLDAPRLRTRAQVTVPRKTADGGVAVDERGRPERADAHVWHCSLSLHPDETRAPDSEPLSDERWAEIAGSSSRRWGSRSSGGSRSGMG